MNKNISLWFPTKEGMQELAGLMRGKAKISQAKKFAKFLTSYGLVNLQNLRNEEEFINLQDEFFGTGPEDMILLDYGAAGFTWIDKKTIPWYID